ncbi:hypothetical protein [Pandoraea pulmonicola]|uniref:Uncharacterized protein n=1 Tax=Pandoraea pulmonicola TaxID=93221 RepID=A0AAJ4ZAY0_PANPU|nr:hypothetical protein [Pandoraea pulmonicola]AJC21257.1 hypothetical protein RO07_13570 [Pandoraea pulmonicola]SUA90045.1 Uncharacterised protein [Pandoraea pulmonicola]
MAIIGAFNLDPRPSVYPGNISADSAAKDISPTPEEPGVFEDLEAHIEAQVATKLDLEFRHLPLQAKALYLDNLNVQVKQKITAALQNLESLSPEDREDLPPELKSSLDHFEATVENVQKNVSDPQVDLVGKYTKYIVALSELVTTIRKQVKGQAEGKSHLNGRLILVELNKFCEKWGKNSEALGKFNDLDAANRAAGRFRAGTVEVVDTGNKENRYEIRVSFSRLIPIAEVVNSPSEVIDNLKNGKHPLDGAVLWEHRLKQVLGEGVNSHVTQSLQLALDEVQKTHNTDVEALSHEASRASTWLDTISQTHSKYMMKLTEILSGFLQV